jgi:putative phage-type endonuclease
MRNIRIVNCEQRSEEWFAARAGRVTGSRAADVMAKIKSGEAAARRDYRLQLAVERITGKPMDQGGFVTADMQRGIDLEPKARQAFIDKSGLPVAETGFVVRDDMPIGCSTDGDLSDFEGILEIKCPKSATHIEYLKGKRIPPKYVWQVTHNVFTTGAKYAHFVSYDDRLPAYLDYFSVTVSRADLPIAEYVFELKHFLAEVESEYQELLKLKA